MTDKTILHAYGVVRGDVDVEMPPSGVAGAPVRGIDLGDVVAVASPLDATRYGEAVWKRHAEDPQWLAAFATQHNAVLEALVASTDVLPFRLPGMYADEQLVRRVLGADIDLLCRGLEAVRDHVEWGVKVFLTHEPEPEPATRPASGREYLRRRSEQAGERERARDDRHRRLLQIHGVLADAASYSALNPPQDPALSGRKEPMLLNSAHLVVRWQREAFFAVVAEVQRELAGSGMTVEVSGPWPPYNFVHLGEKELQGPA